MAMLGHRANFDFQAVGQAGMRLGHLRCFLKTTRHQNHIAADGFFGLGERTIRHPTAVRARNRPRLFLQWTSADRFPFGGQAIVPTIPAFDEISALVTHEVSMRFGAGIAKQEEVRGGSRVGFHIAQRKVNPK